MRTNREGHLEIGGCDTVDLAREYGTPLYVMDEDAIRQACRVFKDSFAGEYGDSEVVFAGKAFMTKAMCILVENEGLGLDVSSGGELYTALKAGFPAERIYFHGNNKSESEIRLGLEAGIGRFMVDNRFELDMLNRLAGQLHVEATVILRITPGVEAHTHQYIRTGQSDSKFGIGIQNGQAMAVVKEALALDNVILKGFHCHIGSQIFELDSFRLAVEIMMDFIKDVRNTTGFMAQELDIGGGLGIRYVPGDPRPGPADLARVVVRALRQKVDEFKLSPPKLLVEPGRYIVGEAGITLYTVGAIKEIPGIRKYLSIDGGMADNPRVALYQAAYHAVLANKADREAAGVVSIAGKCCESGDMLIWDLELPEVEPGDIIAVFSTGAYNYSMASNYNRLPRPAVVFVSSGRAEVVVERETYDDLIARDVVPRRLAKTCPQEVAL